MHKKESNNMVLTVHFPANIRSALILSLTGLIALTAYDVQAEPRGEILHLIKYIENSDCVFIRNDNAYDAKKAGQHLRRKYDYARERVQTADDFIKYIASKSSISGQQYWVRCGNQEISTAKWLSAELKRFREKGALKN